MKNTKQIICTIIALLMIALLAGCGTNEKQTDSPDSGQVSKTASETNTGVDVDLTDLSSTMVYSEVYNMMAEPSKYIGKTIKMKGQFSVYQQTDEKGEPIPDRIYYSCIIQDATACCQQGMEFILAGDAKYPEDYPKQGEEITVTGEYQTYMEDTAEYCHLINAELTD